MGNSTDPKTESSTTNDTQTNPYKNDPENPHTGCKFESKFNIIELHDILLHCAPANKVLTAIEFCLIGFAFYFLVTGLIIILVPLFKGYASILKTLRKNQVYFDLVPNMIVMVVFILRHLTGIEKVAKL